MHTERGFSCGRLRQLWQRGAAHTFPVFAPERAAFLGSCCLATSSKNFFRLVSLMGLSSTRPNLSAKTRHLSTIDSGMMEYLEHSCETVAWQCSDVRSAESSLEVGVRQRRASAYAPFGSAFGLPRARITPSARSVLCNALCWAADMSLRGCVRWCVCALVPQGELPPSHRRSHVSI